MAEIREIPLSAIIPPKLPVRTRADERRISELADSVKFLGLISPITVRPVGDRFKSSLVIAGLLPPLWLVCLQFLLLWQMLTTPELP